MIIMVSTLAAAINEIRHITPEELQRDNIKVIDSEKTENENRKEGEKMGKYTFEILILDDYNNIIYRHYKTCTRHNAEQCGKNACLFYKQLDKTNYHYQIIKIK